MNEISVLLIFKIQFVIIKLYKMHFKILCTNYQNSKYGFILSFMLYRNAL